MFNIVHTSMLKFFVVFYKRHFCKMSVGKPPIKIDHSPSVENVEFKNLTSLRSRSIFFLRFQAPIFKTKQGKSAKMRQDKLKEKIFYVQIC